MSIRVAILGYGNLGKGMECAVKQNDDMELVAVFTRRDPATVKTLTDVKVYNVDQLLSMQDKIDVLVLCGGSATDLPKQTAEYAKYFNVVDSFDTHALRRIPGVKDAKQDTIPVESALEAVRNCENPVLTTRQKHTRECFVVAEEGADKAQIEEQIKTMPNYFADYDTTVHFITEEELQRDHAGIPHGGFVLRTGKTGLNGEHNHVIEYSLKLDSNPEFTSCVLTAYARAAYRMNQEGQKGCKTVFDVAPAYLSTLTPEEMRSALL